MILFKMALITLHKTKESAMKNLNQLLLLIICCLILSSSYIFAKLYSYSTNTLSNNNNWVASKNFKEVSLMGAGHFMITRNGLHKNQLQLGAWHSNQEVIYKKPTSLKRISFNINLETDSYVNFIFNRDEYGFTILRLSNNNLYQSAVISSDKDGKFLTKTIISDLPKMTVNSWHTIELESKSNSTQLKINSQIINTKIPLFEKNKYFGFRNGKENISIDDIKIISDNFSDLEDFSNNNFPQHFLVTFLILSLITLGLHFYLKKNTIFTILFTHLVILTLSTLLLFFDFFYWSKLYTYDTYNPRGIRPNAFVSLTEDLRFYIFNQKSRSSIDLHSLTPSRSNTLWKTLTNWQVQRPWTQSIKMWSGFIGRNEYKELTHKDIQQFYRKKEQSIRIGFIGTSQTEGSGADTYGDTFVSIIHNNLQRKIKSKQRLETFNFSVAGSNSTNLLNEYISYYSNLNLDLLIIALAINDDNYNSLVQNVSKMVSINQNKKSINLVVIEALDLKLSPTNYTANQKALLNFVRKNNIPYHDLNSSINSDKNYDTGLIWWDLAHFTNYGHSLTAQILENKIWELLHRK